MGVERSRPEAYKGSTRKLAAKRIALGAAGILVGAAAFTSDCKGENEPAAQPTQTIQRTTTAETSTTTETQPRLQDITRNNYLDVFSTDEYEFKEEYVLLAPTDSTDDFIRVRREIDEGSAREGAFLKKIDKASGGVEEIRSTSEFMDVVGPVDSKQKALGLVFLNNEEAEFWFEVDLPESTVENEYVGAVLMYEYECKLGRFRVNRNTGEISVTSSTIGEIEKGECGNQ